MERYAIIEPWSWGIEVEYADTYEQAVKIRDGACKGSVIYVKVREDEL